MLEDDQALIDAVAEGHADAFESVYRTHKDRLLTATMSLLRGERSVSEDVLHDVFLQFIDQARSLRLRNSLGKYLMSCCLNRARDHLRRQAVHRKALGQTVERTNNSVAPSSAMEAAEQQTRIMRLLAELPDDQREVVALHVHGDMTFQEIADAVGISVNTAKSRYRYALSKLRDAWPALHAETGDA